MINNFLKDKFNLSAISFCGGIFILIIVISFLNLSQKPHIRFFEVIGEEQSADFTNQKVKIYFSSPMNKDKTSEYINIEPAAKFRTAWSNNNLFLIFEQNLAADTTYKISFNSNFKNLYNESLQSDQQVEFKTKSLTFLYVQLKDGKRSIVKSDLNLNTQTVYSDDNIQTFDAGGNNLVVIVNKINKTNDIKIINLKTLKVDTLNGNNNLILDIAFSPTRNEFAYVRQSAVVKPEYTQPLEDTSIVIYNLDTKDSKSIDFVLPGEGVTNIQFSPDGNSILYKTSQSYYQLIDISNTQNVIQLGRFLSSGGFNFDGSKLSFVEFDPILANTKNQYIVSLSVERNSTKITDGEIPVLDPQYYHNSNKMLYAEEYKDLERTKGIYRIVSIDSDSLEKHILIEDDKRSIEIPKISFDDSYILVEGYYDTDLLSMQKVRIFDFQTKPESGDLMLYNIQTKSITKLSERGYDAIWIR